MNGLPTLKLRFSLVLNTPNENIKLFLDLLQHLTDSSNSDILLNKRFKELAVWVL
jgi:hypothetical protein